MFAKDEWFVFAIRDARRISDQWLRCSNRQKEHAEMTKRRRDTAEFKAKAALDLKEVDYEATVKVKVSVSLPVPFA